MAKQKNGKRGVVIIMTDTQRKDMLGCYGTPGMITPNLDRLAASGMRCENAFTCQPVCGPARAALFTGTFPHSNGSWGNTMPLGTTVKTIGQRLQDNSVHTAYIGKWHLDGGDYFGMGRCPDGWDPDYWYDMRNYLEELTPEERRLSRMVKTNIDPGINEEFTFAHRCSNRAIDFLSKHHDEDFCLVVSYDEPHHPFLCPRKYREMYENYEFPVSENVFDDLHDKPEHLRVWAKPVAKSKDGKVRINPVDFFACNSFVDAEIGRVLDAIDQYAPGSLVIYTSDHGDMLFSHQLTGKGPAMFNEITNIPFLIRWPGVVAPEQVCHELISHIDVVPTVLEYFNIPRSKVLEGHSLMPLITRNQPVNQEIFMEFGRYEIDHDGFGGFQPIRCIFDGRWKLVINLLTSDELYDLQEDPQEMRNRIDDPQCAAIRDRLHDRLLDWMNQTRDPFRGYYWEIRPWRKDARQPSWEYTGMTRQREEDLRYEPRQLDYETGLEMENATRQK